MMLQRCGASSTDLRFSAQPYVSSPPFKLHTPFPPLDSKLALGFESRSHLLDVNYFHQYRKCLQTPKKGRDGVFLGFRVQCHSKTVALTNQNANRGNWKRKKYGGILPSILRELEAEKDVGKILDIYYANLSPKEQTVILKEQSKWDKALRVFEWFKSQKDYVPNVIHYNVVLRALGRSQRWDELRLCWIDMARKGVIPTNNTYGMLVDVYGKAGLVKEALLWIKHMKLRGVFPDEVTMSTVIKVLKDAGEFDRADRFFKDWCAGKIEFDDLDLDNISDQQAITLKEFLSTELFRTGGRSHSLGDTEDVDESSVRTLRLTSTYNTLIDLYGKAGRLKDAADVFADMLRAGVAPDTFTFNTMIFICGSHGHMYEAEALLDKMEERGISPDTKTYNIFLSLYAAAGNMEAVLRCYRKIREASLFPDDVTHRAILKILSERNMVQEVEDVIQEMNKLGRWIDESSLPLLVKMYVDAGFLERAKLLVQKFQSSGGVSSKTYTAVMDVYAEKGLWAEAEALFHAKRDGCGQKDVSEYNVMIKAYGNAKLYDKAISLFQGMRNQGTWPDECTYNSVIQMLAGGDLVDEGKDVVAEMQKAGFKPKCSTYSAIIDSFAKNKRLSDAVNVFQEMLQADVKPNEVVYGLLINAFAEDGRFEEVRHYFQAMEDSGIPANRIVLTSMIKAYGKIGYVEGAKQLYERMKKLDGGPDIVASNSMLKLYSELGMLSEAKAMFDFLREEKLADGITFTTMMNLYKNMGMLNEAIEVAGEVRRSGLVKDTITYNKVLACYATNGQLLECGELLHEMVVEQELPPDARTYKVMFTILKKGGVPIEAVKQLESSYQEGKSFVKQAVMTSVFSIVGLHSYALKSCGIFKKQDAVLNSSAAYNAAIRAYVAYGKIDEALNMFMRMQDEGIETDIVTLINLVNCYGKAGMLEGVKRIHSQLKYGTIEPSESLYKAVVDAYRSLNRHELAELASQEMKFASDVQEFSDMGTDAQELTDSETEGANEIMSH